MSVFLYSAFISFDAMIYPIRKFIFWLFLFSNHTAFTQNQAQSLNPSLLNDVPESEINLPIHLDLGPFYKMANNKVDTLFTSPGYPNAWVQEGCDVRYKYSFRRGPLQFSLNGTTLVIGFTGFYKIVGSSRACVNGVALSPWTPECKCGFDEGERRVNISYSIQITLLKNYKVLMRFTRNEPQPLDKCTVCFWGQDITETVMASLKSELDASKKEMEKNYGVIDLKPQFQDLWARLNMPYNLNNMGWLQINPQAIRVNRFKAVSDKLDISIGLSAKPVVSFSNTTQSYSLPNISDFKSTQGFNIYIDGRLRYDSLSILLSKQIKGKEFDFSKGPIRKKFILSECNILGVDKGRLKMEIKFEGTDNGYFYVTGFPVYNDSTHLFSFEDVAFDIKSKDAMLKMADWLFSKKITREIETKARYDLTEYVKLAKTNIKTQLNREFVKGITGNGDIYNITIAAISPMMDYLLLRMNGTGSFQININSSAMAF